MITAIGIGATHLAIALLLLSGPPGYSAKRMPIFANDNRGVLYLPGHPSGTEAKPSLVIDLSGHWLQVSRIHAAANSTKMIKFKTLRDAPIAKLPKPLVGHHGFPYSLKFGISATCFASEPQPATRVGLGRNMAPESFQYRKLGFRHRDSFQSRRLWTAQRVNAAAVLSILYRMRCL